MQRDEPTPTLIVCAYGVLSQSARRVGEDETCEVKLAPPQMHLCILMFRFTGCCVVLIQKTRVINTRVVRPCESHASAPVLST